MKTTKSLRKSIKIFFTLSAILSVLIFSAIIYVDKNVAESYKINKGEVLKIDSLIPVKATGIEYKDEKVKLNIFGIIPAGKTSVQVVENNDVVLLGTPFGIKIYTDGVLVVDFGSVDGENGEVNPAKEAGIKKGDFIVSLNGTHVYTNEDVAAIIKDSNGSPVAAEIVSGGQKKTVYINPVKSKKNGIYRAGIWVKDSSAGIGTLTFYNPSQNTISGLGHGICDTDTGTLLSLASGELVSAEILSIKKGVKGSPGELVGKFTGKSIAHLNLNTEKGVYGRCKININSDNLIKIASKQEIKGGDAQIYTTISDEGPQYYSCKIKVLGNDETQNLLVTITDQRLLDKTGGIVQGMSGSPIIQNGKLIGAVTHVLVDDPTKGYAIFAENMLETAQSVASEQLKEAS